MALLLATFFLISLLPNSVSDKKQHNDKKRRVNPKFAGRTDSNQDSNLELPSPDEIKAWSGHYGDRYAYFDDTKTGNFEPRGAKPANRPGDDGKEFVIENEKDVDLNEVHSLKSEYGMNIAASNRIPMDRSIPDIRLVK